MISLDYARRLARYNVWMNDKVYAAAATLDEAARHAERGAYFGSIHGTLLHLVIADSAWLARFRGLPLPESLPDRAALADFAALQAKRIALDAELSAFVDTLKADWLAGDFPFTTMTGLSLAQPAWVCVTHLFNHQTHHRGQLTTLLTQLGLDVGVTDFVAMPDDAS